MKFYTEDKSPLRGTARGWLGAKFGGKSWFLCVWSYLFACDFAKRHKIRQSAKPLVIGFLGRKVAKNFADTTLETWYKTIPPAGYVAKGNPVELIIDNRVKILTGGLDSRETINKFNSAEFAFFAIDQAEEVTQDDISLLRGATFGRLVVNGKVQPGKGLFTANPRKCWLKREFITHPDEHRCFVSALPTDNPYCSQTYINNLKDAFKHRPNLLRAYLKGDWRAIEDPDVIIKVEWVDQAAERTFFPSNPRELLVCDVARYGDNETVIYHMRETEILFSMIYGKKDTYFTSNLLMQMSDKAGGIPIVIDECGVGGAVVDNLKGHEGYEVHGIDSQAKADDPEKYHNTRAQMWWEAGIAFSEGDVALHHPDEVFQDQLSTLRYSFRNGRILVQSSDEIKEEHGRHLDRACAYIMGLYGLKWAKVPMNIRSSIRTRDRWDRKPRKTTAMAS